MDAFVGNLPQTLDNHLLRELLELFGDVKEMRRGRDLKNTPSPWVFVKYHQQSSADALHKMLSNMPFGSGRLAVHPAREGECECSEKLAADVDAINQRHIQELEMEGILNRFVSSYNLLYTTENDNAWADALGTWLEEEREIRRRCRDRETSIEKDARSRRTSELEYLAKYDDDRANNLFYTNRAALMSGRR